ncbi:hypothetical protein NQ317_013555 [Molorchus minor]|uniref:Uncharacterized protein n=1 Tax=Molorchus minor TaxID=1323400 RepID=A0ABQ9JS79_9CUCU|nr:hypothetical protein NQ317_013555 [Molorchus minor]
MCKIKFQITHIDDAYQHTSELNGNRPAELRHGPPCFVIRHSELRQPYSIRTVINSSMKMHEVNGSSIKARQARHFNDVIY